MPLGGQPDILRHQPVLIEIYDGGMVPGDIFYEMLERHSVEELTEFRDRSAGPVRDILLVDRHRKRKESGIPAHEDFGDCSHLFLRQRHVIQGRARDNEHHFRLDVDILHDRPVPFSLYIFYGIPCRGTVQSVADAELMEVELQLHALADIIRNPVHHVHLVVYVLHIFKRRE